MRVESVLLAAVAAVLSLAATPLAARLALRLGAVDLPGPRRVHAHPTPRLGGLAVAAAIVGAILLARMADAPAVGRLFEDGDRMRCLLAGGLIVVAVGVADDVYGLSPAVKLLAETIAAAVALAGGYGLGGVTNPFTGTYVALGDGGALLTILWIVAITNAFNLIDGLDGLAAGVGVIAATTLLVVAWIEGRADAVPLWAALAGALGGFLVYNSAPASIFLGDSGSLLVGYLIALFALQGVEKSATLILLLAPVLALGLPLVDVGLAVGRRAVAGGLAGVLHADRAHLHHRLVAEGLSHRRAVFVLYAVASACGALAVFATVTQSVLNAVVVLGAALIVWIVLRWARARSTR